MRVILIEDVKNLGKKHDVKEVSEGYARNFLFPRRLAQPATAGALSDLEKLKQHLQKDEDEHLKHLRALAALLGERTLLFELKTDEATGAVFGSVSRDSILKALRSNGLITTERLDIKLEHPLKVLGEHTVDVDLKKGVTAKLKLTLRKQA